MNILFIHDHPFYIDKAHIYSGGGLPAKTWNNYLLSFDRINVIGRHSHDLKDKKVLSSGNDRVIFNLIEEYSSIKNLFINFFKIKRKIQEQILLNDLAIIRLPSIFGFIAGYLAIKNKKIFIIEQVGNAKEAMSFHKSFLGKISASIFHKINKLIIKKAPYVIYVTEKKLQKDYPTQGKTESISNVILPQIITPEDIDVNRFTDEKLKIALIGGFDTQYKGQNILLQAISLLPTSVKQNIELYYIGKGNYDWVIEMARHLSLLNNIKFIGPKTAGDEILSFLKSISLYIQPSFTEGMPRAMLEAMSVACPVLASNVGGIPDLLKDDLLHKAGDYKRLSEHILYFYEKRDLLISESLINLQKVKPYLKDNLDKKRQKFYELILNEFSI